MEKQQYEKKAIVTAEDLDRLFNLSPENRKQIVFRLKKKRILSPIKRGVYVFSPLEAGPEGMGVDELLVPPLFFPTALKRINKAIVPMPPVLGTLWWWECASHTQKSVSIILFSCFSGSLSSLQFPLSFSQLFFLCLRRYHHLSL